MAMKSTTPKQQIGAMDVVIRAALTNERGPLTDELRVMLGSLPREAGIRVANIMIMLAGAAVADVVDWRQVLQDHLGGTDEETE
jgi:hypothetical protein